MAQEERPKLVQYNVTKLQTYFTFHVILLSLLNKVGVSIWVSPNSKNNMKKKHSPDHILTSSSDP